MKHVVTELVDEGRTSARHGVVSGGAYAAICTLALMLAASAVGVFAQMDQVRPERKVEIAVFGAAGAALAAATLAAAALVAYGYLSERAQR